MESRFNDIVKSNSTRFYNAFDAYQIGIYVLFFTQFNNITRFNNENGADGGPSLNRDSTVLIKTVVAGDFS